MNLTILQYLSIIFMNGQTSSIDSKYSNIIEELLSKINAQDTSINKLSLLQTSLGPCTTVNYNLYYHLLSHIFIDKDELGDNLLNVNSRWE